MDKLSVFSAITAAAVVLQALVLLAIFLALRKTSARVESLADEVRIRALPAFESAQNIMAESRGPLENILSNLQTTTELLRVQAVRADQVITRTMDRLDRASTTVNAVVTPARQISGIFQGVSVGIDAFLRSRQRRRQGVSGPNDEMFI